MPANWTQFAELGWLGMAFSEEDGGYGGEDGSDDALLPSPFRAIPNGST